MNKGVLNKVLLTLIPLFCLTMFLPLVLLDRTGRANLDRRSQDVRSALRQYVRLQDDVFSFIASDNVLKSSAVQMGLGGDLAVLQQHLGELKMNFPDVRLISLYDRDGRLYLSTDYQHAETGLPMSQVLQLEGPDRRVVYVRDYNRYLYGVTAPMLNYFNLKAGFIRIYADLGSFLRACGLSRDWLLFLRQDGRTLFLQPQDTAVSEADLNALVSVRKAGTVTIAGRKYLRGAEVLSDAGMSVVLCYRYFNGPFTLITGLNLLLVALLGAWALFLARRRREDDADRTIQSSADEIFTLTQHTLREVYILGDRLQQINTQKDELKTRLEKMKITPAGPATGETQEVNEFKVIKPF